jgi:hypothetical protein
MPAIYRAEMIIANICRCVKSKVIHIGRCFFDASGIRRRSVITFCIMAQQSVWNKNQSIQNGVFAVLNRS